MKKVHIILSRKQWEELQEIKKKSIVYDTFHKEDLPPKTYEEYLEQEKRNPTMALFG